MLILPVRNPSELTWALVDLHALGSSSAKRLVCAFDCLRLASGVFVDPPVPYRSVMVLARIVEDAPKKY